ncbi:DUF624 domain-containing protein [Halobacillus fulvus]|nr:DUF624 domain-containing protein [Halobacillus fulvus]
MYTEGWEKIYILCVWIARLAYVNLLWFLFTMGGFVLIGFFPATAALFHIANQWLQKEEVPIFQTFWKTFLSYFWRANGAGWIFAVAGYVLYVDYVFVNYVESLQFFMPLLFILFVGYLMTLLFLFPVLVFYQLPISATILKAAAIALANPMEAFLMMLVILFFPLFLAIFPSLLFFFTGSLLSFVVMLFGLRAFEKTEKNISPSSQRL